jgi:RNA polymerase sigma-70 factor (ECF subfamily)
VVAETFLVVWRRIRDAPDNPLPWLLGVCGGVVANSLQLLDY